MIRYGCNLDIAKTQGVAAQAGASVAVRVPGTTVALPVTLYAGPSGPATLSNPFTTATGMINFHLGARQQVNVQITLAGGAAQTFSNVRVDASQPMPSPLSANGQVANWFVS